MLVLYSEQRWVIPRALVRGRPNPRRLKSAPPAPLYNEQQMDFDFRAIPERLFGPDLTLPGYLIARWLFLRALGAIFFSAFYSLGFQIRGLIGPSGILPAQEYLVQVARVLGRSRFWYAPTVFWWSASDRFLMAVVVIGMVASVLLIINVAPRGTLVVCIVAFLSFIAAAQDFASYQSDGMLLEAGFISLFLAPTGWRPGWGASEPSFAGQPVSSGLADVPNLL